MAAGGLLALLDDITALLDDIAVMTKVAAAKAAGITGDDLAVNAEAMIGIDPKRELPIVWRVAKGSFRNKLILIPAALALSAFADFLITPLLMLGAAYLCFEAAEKVLHAAKPRRKPHASPADAAAAAEKDLAKLEKQKISGAVQTDFILSAEIVAVTLGIVKDMPFGQQAVVLCLVGVAMTIGVYGLVAGIVKIDDLGMLLSRRKASGTAKLGRGILRAAPWLMKSLAFAGTAAMFLVGGGIVVHGIPTLSQWMESLPRGLHHLAMIGLGMALGFAVAPLAALAGKIVYAWKRRKK